MTGRRPGLDRAGQGWVQTGARIIAAKQRGVLFAARQEVGAVEAEWSKDNRRTRGTPIEGKNCGRKDLFSWGDSISRSGVWCERVQVDVDIGPNVDRCCVVHGFGYTVLCYAPEVGIAQVEGVFSEMQVPLCMDLARDVRVSCDAGAVVASSALDGHEDA